MTLTLDEVKEAAQFGRERRRVKLASLARFINENLPHLEARMEDGHYTTEGRKSGRIYTTPPVSHYGKVLHVYDRKTGEEVFKHNPMETYCKNRDVAYWIVRQMNTK